MNLRAACAVALAALAALPAIAPAADPTEAAPAARSAGTDAHAVEHLERRWIDDIERGDRADLATILAEDYRDVDWRGRVRDKQALLADVANPGDASQHVSRLRVRTWADTAVATGINEVRSGASGSVVEIAFTDVFARIDGRWRAVSSQETLRRPSDTGAGS